MSNRREVSKDEFIAFLRSRPFEVYDSLVTVGEPMCMAYAAHSPSGTVIAVRELGNTCREPGDDRFYLTDREPQVLESAALPEPVESERDAAAPIGQPEGGSDGE